METEVLNFWDYHGWGFIIALLFFPRLTMLCTGILSKFWGGWFFFGWLFAPRITTAVMAISLYWESNPVLCILSVLLIGGNSTSRSQSDNKVIKYDCI
jgi:hypothetical protein